MAGRTLSGPQHGAAVADRGGGEFLRLRRRAAARRCAGAICDWRRCGCPFLVYLVLLCITAGAIFLAPETVTNPKRRLAEVALRPRLGVPQQIWLQFVAPAVAAFAAFALIGFYAALGAEPAARKPASVRALDLAGAIVCRVVLHCCGDDPFHRQAGKPRHHVHQPGAAGAELWLFIALQFLSRCRFCFSPQPAPACRRRARLSR